MGSRPAVVMLPALLASWLALSAPVTAEFAVTATVPADGDAGVALVTAVSFTFSAPLDTAARFGEQQTAVGFAASDPRDSLQVGAFSYSPDLRTATVAVTHTPGTDFVWIVTGARSADGESLSHPYALNYTTAASRGTRAVSGAVTDREGQAAEAVVVLMDRALFGGPEGSEPVARVGAVSDPQGGYTAGGVRDGLYWPLAARDVDGDGVIDPAGPDVIGVFDPNGDGQPDPIEVSGSDLAGVDIAVRPLFEAVTARSYLDQAIAMAAQYAADQQLKAVFAHADPAELVVGLDGTAMTWVYQFYSPSAGRHTLVFASSFFAFAQQTETDPSLLPPEALPLPADFIDSDAVMAAAEAGGGADFAAAHQVVGRRIWAADTARPFPGGPPGVAWIVQYDGVDAAGTRRVLLVAVDMVTGQLRGAPITAVEDGSRARPAAWYLAQNYPNPFNPVTHIPFGVERRGPVSLVVFDALGRHVATLLDGEVDAGAHTVSFDATGMAAGVYFYRLTAPGFAQTRRLVVLR